MLRRTEQSFEHLHTCYGLALFQERTAYPRRLGRSLRCPSIFYRGCEVIAFAQEDTGLDVELADGRSLKADYLVCDRGRSLVRKRAGIDLRGL